jgi:hypothetical protein
MKRLIFVSAVGQVDSIFIGKNAEFVVRLKNVGGASPVPTAG